MKIEIEGPGKRLRVYIGEKDHFHGKPFYEAIVYKLREKRIAGATVLRGIEGFGAGSQVIHTANILRLSNDLPIIIEVVDNEEEINKAADIIKTMLEEAKCGVLMTVENIEILRYSP
jgi:PII-like signaling protein